MKQLRKIGALVVVLLVIMSLSATVFADTLTQNATVSNATVDPAIRKANGLTTIVFNVYLTPNESSYYMPATKFTYTISDGTAGISASGIPIKSGSANETFSSTSASATFTLNTQASNATPDINNLASAKTEVTLALKDSLPFTSAGIYRYNIIQSAMTHSQKGFIIKSEKIDDAVTKYLDLYVTIVDDALKVTGAVLTEKSTNPTTDTTDATNIHPNDSQEIDTLNDAFSPNKTDGFYNTYTGYIVELKKVVAGNMASTTDPFPFNLTTVDSTNVDDDDTYSAGLTVAIDRTNADSTNWTVDGTTIGTTISSGIALKHNQSVKLVGIPASDAITFKETITAAEGYKISSSVANMSRSSGSVYDISTSTNNKAENSTYNNDTSGTVATVLDNNTGIITYTNFRDVISPTGIIMRFAPYALMLIGGIALLIIAMKRKGHKEEE